MDGTTQTITILILLFAFVFAVIATQFVRRRRDAFALRPMPAYETLPLLVGEAIEADRPLHLSFGSATLGGNDTVFTLASAELLYQVAQRSATGSVTPIITQSDTTVIPLAQDTLRRAYRSRDRLERYRMTNIQWYPSTVQPLAFAAALTGTLGDEKISSNILTGTYGTELALILGAANRRDQTSIATSTRLEGQAIAYAMADRPLLGEEIITAGAYLDRRASPLGSVIALDTLRSLLILALILPTVVIVGDSFTNNLFSTFVARLTDAVLNLVGR